MDRLDQFPFVQVYMVASFVAFLWFGVAFPVGIWGGAKAGARTLTSGLAVYVAAIAVTTVWAVTNGQWARFSAAIGTSVLLEMGLFAAVWLYIMYFMASRYIADKRRSGEVERRTRMTDGISTSGEGEADA